MIPLSRDKMRAGHPRPGRSLSGFTLVEMLVACAVAMLLLVTLVGIVSQSLTVSKKTNNALLAYNEAATAVDLIANDLESLASTAQPYEYLQTVKEDVQDATGVTRLLMLSVSSQDNSANADTGQVRAISYRLLHQDPIKAGGTNNVYGLYRSVLTTQDTFANFVGNADLNSAFSPVAATLDDFVAGNVVDFQIRFYPAGNQPAANLNGLTIQPVRISGNGTKVDGNNYPGVLAWAEVTLTVLDDNATKLLEAGSIDMATAKQRHGHLLTRRIALRSPH